MRRHLSSTPPRAQAAPGTVRELSFAGDDAALIARVRERHPAAVAAFYDRFSGTVLRVLARILGADRELEDLHQDVFAEALASIGGVRDPGRLTSWVVGVSVRVAHGAIRRRTRRRWLVFVGSEPAADVAAPGAGPEATAALRAAYVVLDGLPAEERIVFALRFLDGMEIEEVAAASGMSRATVYRKLGKARARFLDRARHHAVLADWCEGVAE